MLKLKFLGAAGTVTGSKTLIEYGSNQYMIDCGLFQGMKEIRLMNWEELKVAASIKAIILTHAHIDHSGYLPKICNEGFKGKVFCSEGTKELCKILLPDSGYLQEEDAMFANKTKHSSHDPALPLYTQADAEKCLERLHSVSMNEWTPLEAGLEFRFLNAGHILGSCIVQIKWFESSQEKILTFTGDLGNGRSHVLPRPDVIEKTDYLVAESTYGDRLQERGLEFEQIQQIVNKVIARGGTLIIPAFAVGRTQELLFILNQLQVENKIPKAPIYLDSPMAQEVTELYQAHQFKLPEVTFTKSADESMLLCMSDEPKVVISAAGMLTGGRVLHHLKMKLPHEKNGVLFVGYQAQGTKGLLIKNGLRKIRLHHQEIDIEAEVFSMESLSAHADSDDMIAWMKNIKLPPRKVFLNHGEQNALFAMKYRIENEILWPAEVPIQGAEYSL